MIWPKAINLIQTCKWFLLPSISFILFYLEQKFVQKNYIDLNDLICYHIDILNQMANLCKQRKNEVPESFTNEVYFDFSNALLFIWYFKTQYS